MEQKAIFKVLSFVGLALGGIGCYPAGRKTKNRMP